MRIIVQFIDYAYLQLLSGKTKKGSSKIIKKNTKMGTKRNYSSMIYIQNTDKVADDIKSDVLEGEAFKQCNFPENV